MDSEHYCLRNIKHHETNLVQVYNFHTSRNLSEKKIPKEKLCKNELYKVDMITPSGKTLGEK